MNFYKDAKDLNASGKSGRDKKSRDSQRIFINIGEKDGFDWATLKDLLREKTSMTNDDFGGVDVKGAFSFFNVSKSKVEGVFEAFEGFSVGDRKVSLELTKTSKSPDRRGGGRDRRRGGRRDSSRDRRGSSGSRNRSGSRSRRERRK